VALKNYQNESILRSLTKSFRERFDEKAHRHQVNDAARASSARIPEAMGNRKAEAIPLRQPQPVGHAQLEYVVRAGATN